MRLRHVCMWSGHRVMFLILILKSIWKACTGFFVQQRTSLLSDSKWSSQCGSPEKCIVLCRPVFLRLWNQIPFQMCPAHGEMAGVKRYHGSKQVWLAKRTGIFTCGCWFGFGKKLSLKKRRKRSVILGGLTFPFAPSLFLLPLLRREKDTISSKLSG